MKLDRLVSILVMLLRKERVQAKELAEMFDVSVRTILRDVDAINMAGIPIVTYQGVNGGIGIAEGYRLDKSVLTGDDMAAILTTLRGVAKTLPDSRHTVIMEKFKNTLSNSQLELVNSKANELVIDLSPWGRDEATKTKAASIRKAIEAVKEIEFTYTDNEGSRTSRSVEPYSLLLKSQKWYLYAWCKLRQEFRLFKLSRISELSLTNRVFKKREVTIDEHPWEGEWQKPQNMVALQLVFEKDVSSIAVDYFGTDVEELEDGRILINASMPENNWLYGFILSFGTEVEVINPPYIREILKEISRKIYEKYL